MTKPLKQFGGWLRFFQVFCGINITLMIVVVIGSMLFAIVDMSLQSLTRNFVNMAQAGLILYFCARIVKNIVDPARSIPRKIQRDIIRIVITYLIFHLIQIPLAFWFKDVTIDLAFYVTPAYIVTLYTIWLVYFQHSKRVAAYYRVANESEELVG